LIAANASLPSIVNFKLITFSIDFKLNIFYLALKKINMKLLFLILIAIICFILVVKIFPAGKPDPFRDYSKD
jgi:hypothetical protein